MPDPAAHASTARSLSSWGVVAAFVAVAVGFAIRATGAAQPLGIDQGIFSAAAAALLRGDMLYLDAWDQKPPAIHLTYAAAFALAGQKTAVVFWMDFAASVLTGGFLALTAGLLAGRRAAAIAAAVWAIGSLPLLHYSLGGFLERAVPETFIIVFVTAAMAVAAAAARGRVRPTTAALLAGLAIGIAATYKPNALAAGPAVLLWFVLRRRADDPPVSWMRALVAFGVGVLVAPAAIGVWLWSRGALDAAWVAVVEYNRAYLSVGVSGPGFFVQFLKACWLLVKTDVLWTCAFLAGLAALGRAIRDRRRYDAELLAILWMGAALAGVAASGSRLYTTYFIATLPVLALLVALSFARLTTRAGVWVWSALLVAATAVVIVRTPVVERFTTTLEADWSARSGATPSYLERFGGYGNGRGFSARANAELVAYLREHSTADETVFIYGMQPGVYFEAHRRPANRFLWVGPILGRILDRPDFRVEAFISDLARSRPVWLIREDNNRDSQLGWTVQEEFARPEMAPLLSSYQPVTRIEDFAIYRRID